MADKKEAPEAQPQGAGAGAVEGAEEKALESKWVEIYRYYRSCSGATSSKRFSIAFNVLTGEVKSLMDLLKENNASIKKDPPYWEGGCSVDYSLYVPSKVLADLNQEGWIFKELSFFRGRFRGAEYWTVADEVNVKVIEQGIKDRGGWHDIIEVNSNLYKIYKDKIVPLNR